MSTKPPKNSNVAVYLRVSTLDQEKGLESQQKAIEAFLKGHGISDAVWYRDRLSGKDTRRPAFEKLQKDIFCGKVKTVVTWRLDRISRSMRDGVNVLCDWLEKDIRVVAVSQQFDFSGPVGKLIAGVLFAIAELDREAIRTNTCRGLEAARKKGIKLGKPRQLFAGEIVPMLEQGQTVAAVAAFYNVSAQAVYRALKREGIALADITRSNPTRKDKQ